MVLYVLAPPTLLAPERGHGHGQVVARAVWDVASQLTALVGLTSLALSFVLGSRFKPLERRLGGLDQMYRLHHHLGMLAFCLLIAHPFLFALRFIPRRVDHFSTFWFPVHRDLAVNLGVIAFWLFIILIVLTLLRRFPYNWWKWTHRLMVAVLALGVWHMLAVEPTPGRAVANLANPILRGYLITIIALAGLAYLYRWTWVPLVHGRYQYRVSKIDRITDDILIIRLIPEGPTVQHTPGQFVFVRFKQPGISTEQHPYTICGPSDRQGLTISVKVLGDYTRKLYDKLEEGSAAQLEGPYGQFDYRKGGRRQIWLAGGIGVTPFICWLHQLEQNKDTDRHIDFYYCVHSRDETIYRHQLDAWADELPGVNVHVVCTGEHGRLTADRLELVEGAPADVFICGPRGFVHQLHKQLRSRGMPDDRLHHEAFEFR
jgi:predicted ferric reductase